MKIVLKVIAYVGVVLICCMGLLTLSDVTGRFIFNSPIRGSFEITSALLFAIAGCAAAAAMAGDEHIKVDMLTDKVSASWKHILKIFACFLGFVAFAAITWQNAIVTWESFIELEPMSTAFIVPIYPFRTVATLAFAITAIAFLYEMVLTIRSRAVDIEGNKEEVWVE